MKKQMEAKNVIKIILPLVFLLVSSTALCQRTKYLLFDKTKDSIIKIENTKYFKIDNNLFDIDRYNEVDSIDTHEFEAIKLSTVKELWEDGRNAQDSIIKEGVKRKRIKVIETYNQIFEYIYILEKKSNCKFIRTRGWWIDY